LTPDKAPVPLPLRTIDIQPVKYESGFPFTVPIVRGWEALTLTSPVTFFVGENGSGKSTILEALAAAAGSITAGEESAGRDPSLSEVRKLAQRMRLTWNKRTRKGFFLRAEAFIGFIKRQQQTRAEMEAEIRRVDEEYSGRSEYARGLAKMPYAGQLHAMQGLYGDGLELRSHGEQFLDFFQARFVPEGLYLLDEPEAPLSPLRQLGFLALLKEMVAAGAQFIIVTHSPILMAFPGAEIFSFDQSPARQVAFNDLEHVRLTRDFLNHPDEYLRHL
jgi:predicted ATPase